MTLQEELSKLSERTDLSSDKIAHIAMTEYYIVLDDQIKSLLKRTKDVHERKAYINILTIHFDNYKKWRKQYEGTKTKIQIVGK